MADEGTHPAIAPLVKETRAPDGRFLKGNKIAPKSRPGRPSRGDIMPVLTAIIEEFPPEEIGDMIRHGYETAVKDADVKMQLEFIRFVTSYAIGKPIQRSIKAQIDPEEFKRMFQPDSAEEDDDVIDGEVGEAD
jgi:hypothetical protein